MSSDLQLQQSLGTAGNPAPQPGQPGRSGSFVILALPLFLLLLAFFILLTSISNFEEDRIADVIDSIERSFTVDRDLLLSREQLTAREGGTLSAAELLEETGDLFSTAIGLAEVRTVADGEMMVVSVPLDSLFEDQSLSSEEATLLARVASSMARMPDGVRFNLDFVIGAPSSPTEVERTRMINRAGALARHLIASNAPAQSVSVGYGDVQSGWAEFRFSIVPADDRVVDFEHLTVDVAPAGDGP